MEFLAANCRCELKAKMACSVGKPRISSSLQNLKAMNRHEHDANTVIVGVNNCFCFLFLAALARNQIIEHGNGIQIKSTQDFYVFVMVALSNYCCRSSLLRNGVAVYGL